MMTDNTKQNPTVETELSEVTLEQMSGGMGPSYGEEWRRRLRQRKLADPDKPKDGGATGSW